MEFRHVGKSGLRVSKIGLGCNNFGWTIDEAASRAVIDRAIELGVNFFDTAAFYGTPPGNSETILGRVLGARRKDIVLVTKFGLTDKATLDTSRSGVLGEVERSLRRLNTDYIDIYLMHFHDGVTPMQETLRALDDIVSAGKVRYIGCCNLPAWKVVEARWISRTDRLNQFVVAQNEYSLLVRQPEGELMPALQEYGMGLMPYFPLASGLLTGKFAAGKPSDSRLTKNVANFGNRFLSDRNLKFAADLEAFAKARGHSLLELAFSWLLTRPVVCGVIAGATKPQQIEQNAAAGDWKLSAEDLAEIDKICAA